MLITKHWRLILINGILVETSKIDVNSSLPAQVGCDFADDMFRCIFMNEKVFHVVRISLKSVRKGPVDNISALVQIMAWYRTGDKALTEPMLAQYHWCI